MVPAITTNNKFALLLEEGDNMDPPVLHVNKLPKSAVVDKKKNVSSKPNLGTNKKVEVAKSLPTAVTTDKIKQGRPSAEKDGKQSRQSGNTGRQQRNAEVAEKENVKLEQELPPGGVSEVIKASEEDKNKDENAAEKKDVDDKPEDDRPKLTLEEWKAQSKIDQPKFNVRKAGDGCADKDILKKFVPIKREDVQKADEDEEFDSEVILGKRKQREKRLDLDFKFADNKPPSGPRRGDSGNRGRGGPGRGAPSGRNGDRSNVPQNGERPSTAGNARGNDYASGRGVIRRVEVLQLVELDIRLVVVVRLDLLTSTMPKVWRSRPRHPSLLEMRLLVLGKKVMGNKSEHLYPFVDMPLLLFE
uniref:Hyaluronan/mRNA-binding protein domain-containing protein n=1 Tax=Ditylenchus dipsaci TaxID=166011 RepID=A0A915E3S0_9BILA